MYSSFCAITLQAYVETFAVNNESDLYGIKVRFNFFLGHPVLGQAEVKRVQKVGMGTFLQWF